MQALRYSILIFVAAVLIEGCNENAGVNQETVQIGKKLDSLSALSSRKDSLINTFLSAFTEIENNLVSIKQHESSLTIQSKGTAESSSTIKDEVLKNVNSINDLMDQNRKKINSLNLIVKQDNSKIDQLKGLVSVLVSHINDKNMDLISMNRLLLEKMKVSAQLNTAMIDLGIQGIEKSDTINQQKKELDENSKELDRAYSAFGIDIVPEEMPSFPGGDVAMQEFIKNNIRYPDKEKKDKISGRVFVELIVEKDGSLSNLHIKRDVPGGPGLSQEALRLIDSMPKWIPGKEKGKKVRVDLVLPISFP